MRALRNLMMSLLFACGFFAATELLLRALDLPDPGIYAGDIRSFWTLRPNLPDQAIPFRERGTTFRVRTNEAGFRGGPAQPGAILCLGDSTTFGWGVEEEQAWPSVLSGLLGEPVINGGVPGYSSHQGRALLPTALQLKPKRVVLAYLVRDAELAPVADAERPPPPWDPHVMKLLRSLRPAPPGTTPPGRGVPRVGPAAFAENLRSMVAEVQRSGAEVLLLAFPQQTPAPDHLDTLTEVATQAGVPLLNPRLDPDHFFVEDPIHLTESGNATLAGIVATALRPPPAAAP